MALAAVGKAAEVASVPTADRNGNGGTTQQDGERGAQARPGAGSAAANSACEASLDGLADDELELAVKATCRSGMPGREEYLAEQARRREIKLAAKPTWIKIRAAEEKVARKSKSREAAQQKLEAAGQALVAAQRSMEAAEAELAQRQAELECLQSELLELQRVSAAPAAAACTAQQHLPAAVLQLPDEFRSRPDVAIKLAQADAIIRTVLQDSKVDMHVGGPARGQAACSGASFAESTATNGASHRASSAPARRRRDSMGSSEGEPEVTVPPPGT